MKKNIDLFPYMLLLPALFITLLIVAWPLAETVRLSLTDASLKPEENYIGFANYEKILSRRFPEVIGRTFLWMTLAVTLKLLIGLLGALLLNAAVPGRTLFRILRCHRGLFQLRLVCSSGVGCTMANSA